MRPSVYEMWYADRVRPGIELKPSDFFEGNPALDVPPSSQKVNKSVLVQDPWPVAETRVGGKESCCDDGAKPKL
jgi:hypothetical protein